MLSIRVEQIMGSCQDVQPDRGSPLAMPRPCSIADLVLLEPSTPAELDTYYDLRWRVLRRPWDQPRGSERDDLDPASYKLMFKTPIGQAVAVGRLHFNSPEEAQVRYMAVDPDWDRSGLGSRILQGLEAEARKRGAQTMILNSRDQAIGFYEKHGYALSGQAGGLFGGRVQHVRMSKALNVSGSAGD
jgi:GNAT superfamily N-acetyltransferase